MKQFATTFFIALFAFTKLNAQLSYTGNVINKSNGKPLESISVSLLSADSSIISYTYTDEKGYFKIKPTNRGTFLSFSSIAYKRLMFPITQFRHGMVIELEESVVQIREVKITSGRIRRMNDTLTYSISGFKMPQDRNIEDVLKKIPGIEVTSNGTIKFQDKSISNFYIDGMDLLGDRYALGSRNIPVDMVKEVQVLQAHQPITTLRGRSFSDNAALNLVLEENAKNRLVKLIDLGIGAGNGSGTLWDNRLMGLLFSKKMQNLSMYKNNNTGEDIVAEIVPLAKTGIIDLTNENNEEDLFSPSAAQTSNVDPKRYLFNRTHLAAINHLYKPNKKTVLRFQLSALHNDEESDYHSATTYFYPTQTVTINEIEKYSGQENRMSTELDFQLNDSSVYIKNTVKGEIGLHKSTLELSTNGQKTKELIRPERKYLQNNFRLIKNIRKQTFSLYSNNAFIELPQSMTVIPGLYANLLNDNQPYNILTQTATLRAFHSDNYTYFQHKTGGVYLKYRAGLTYKNKQMLSFLYTDNTLVTEQNFANNLRMETVKLYVEPSFNYKNNFWNLQASIPLSLLHLNLEYKDARMKKIKKKRLLPMPQINVRYEMNAYWNAVLLSSFSYIEPDIRQLYTSYLFTSYRSASAYTAQPNFDGSWYNLLDFRFNNPLSGLFFNLSGFYNLSRQNVIYSYENTDGYLTLNKAISMKHNNYFRGIRSRLSKAFSWCKLVTALNLGYSQNDNKLYLEENVVTSSLKTCDMKLTFSMQPNPYFNIEGNSAATYIQSSLDYTGNEPAHTWNYRHELNLNFIFSSCWKANLANTLSHDNQNKSITYFADASITFSHHLFDIELNGHNLLNHAHIDRTFVNGLTKQYSNYSLRPQEVLLKIKFAF